jgi:hypothetical protein
MRRDWALRGHDTIAAAIADDQLATVAEALMVEDVAPTLRVPAGLSWTTTGDSHWSGSPTGAAASTAAQAPLLLLMVAYTYVGLSLLFAA